MLRLPTQCTCPARPTATVGAPDVCYLLAAKVLRELLRSEGGHLGIVGDPKLDEGGADGLAELEPAVLAVLPEVEAFPPVSGAAGIPTDSVEDGDV